MNQFDAQTDREAMFKKAGHKSFGGELWHFLKTSKKWWMLPLLLCFLAMGVILVLAKTAAAPFIYTLF